MDVPRRSAFGRRFDQCETAGCRSNPRFDPGPETRNARPGRQHVRLGYFFHSHSNSVALTLSINRRSVAESRQSAAENGFEEPTSKGCLFWN